MFVAKRCFDVTVSPANPKDKGKQKSKVPQASKTLRDKRQKRKAMLDGEGGSHDVSNFFLTDAMH